MTTSAAQRNPDSISSKTHRNRNLRDQETHQALVAMQAQMRKKSATSAPDPEPIHDMRAQLGLQLENILSMTIDVMDELTTLLRTDQGFSRENIYLLAHAKAIVHTISQFLYPADES